MLPVPTHLRLLRLIPAAVVTVAALVLPAAANATVLSASGAFSSATVDANWTHANFAGSVARTDCGVGDPQCGWFAVVTVQPSLPSYACSPSDWLDASSDHNIRTVWSSGGQTANATIPFSVANAYILQGVFGQRLCLSVVYDSWYPDPVCVAQQPILGGDCPPVNHPGTGAVIATSLPSVQSTPPPTSSTPPITTAPPSTTPTPSTTPIVKCRVPSLARMTLKQARRALNRAHCNLGKVTRKPSRNAAVGRVISQSPRRGKLMHAGARVNVTLGRHR